MSFAFFLLGLFSACLTYNVYRPQFHGRAAVWSFFLGWLWGELAPHVILGHVVLAMLFVAAGAVDGVLGLLGMVLFTTSAAALIYNYLESESAARAIESALRAGLGDDYASRIRTDFRDVFHTQARWRDLVRPFNMRHPEVEKISGIRYDRQRGIDLELDIYRHRSLREGCPVLFQIHGGAWVIGDKKEQALPLMNQMAARGWVCVSANYRLSPHATFPDHLIDCKKALAWVRENGARYGANPDFIVVTGGSAGGHLAALLATTANDPSYQPGFDNVDTSVAACVPLYGVYDWRDRFGFWQRKQFRSFLETRVLKCSMDEQPDLYRRGSPMDTIHDGRPPFLVIHGELDSLAPVEEARRFAEMLRGCGTAPVVYAEIPRAQHAFEIFKCLRGQLVVDGLERYLSYMYSEYLRAREAREDGTPTFEMARGDGSGTDVPAGESAAHALNGGAVG